MVSRLLVVDDEPHLLRALGACLRSEGYEVTTVSSGAEALVRLAEGVPDLVVSDIRMPGVDGFALLRQLRSSPRSCLVPVVFLTAKADMVDRVAGFESGVDAYLTKPFEPEELVAVVASILARVRRTQAEIARLVRDPGAAPRRASDVPLTEAEARVAETVARGLANKEIAAALGISVRTVENHVSHILDKLGLENRVEIARFVLEGHRAWVKGQPIEEDR
jgi:DNA-binding NarL/FixJ family response regulator